jgi:hypothetical protein
MVGETLHLSLFDKHPRPWSIPDQLFDTGHNRCSSAIVDAKDQVVILIDPSEGEYSPSLSDETAVLLVAAVNSERC